MREHACKSTCKRVSGPDYIEFEPCLTPFTIMDTFLLERKWRMKVELDARAPLSDEHVRTAVRPTAGFTVGLTSLRSDVISSIKIHVS